MRTEWRPWRMRLDINIIVRPAGCLAGRDIYRADKSVGSRIAASEWPPSIRLDTSQIHKQINQITKFYYYRESSVNHSRAQPNPMVRARMWDAPARTIRLAYTGLNLGQRRRRWAKVQAALTQFLNYCLISSWVIGNEFLDYKSNVDAFKSNKNETFSYKTDTITFLEFLFTPAWQNIGLKLDSSDVAILHTRRDAIKTRRNTLVYFQVQLIKTSIAPISSADRAQRRTGYNMLSWVSSQTVCQVYVESGICWVFV